MDNRHDTDISADDLIAKLKANIGQTDDRQGDPAQEADRKKRYKFRRSDKSASAVTEDDILREMPEKSGSGFVSPVPKSEIEGLDIDELMKKYLPEKEYERLSKKKEPADRKGEEEFVRTLTSPERVAEDREESAASDGQSPSETERYVYKEGSEDYTAPDEALFTTLSDGGKVCDIPGEDDQSAETITREPVRAGSGEAGQTHVFSAPTLRQHGGEERGPATDDGAAAPSARVNDGVTTDSPEHEMVRAEADEELPSGENADLTRVMPPVGGGSEASEKTIVLPAVTDGEGSALRDAEENAPPAADDREDGAPEKNGDGEMPAVGAAAAEEDSPAFDETDANLMIAFGMDDELEKAMGKENADKLRSDIENLYPDEPAKPKKQREERKRPVREYISPVETKEIMENYKTAFGKNALALFATAAVVMILFFYENIPALGGTLPDAVNPAYYPAVNVLVGLQLLFLGFAVNFRSLVRGVEGLLDRKPVPESFLPLILLVHILYSVAVCFFEAGTVPLSFAFPSSVCLLLTALNERMNLRREIMTFNIISSKRTKFALEKLELDDAELESKAFDEFLPKQPSVFKINKTAFIDGYFRRTGQYPTIKYVLKAFLPVSAAVIVAAFTFGLLFLKDWQSAVMLSYTAFFFTLPGTVFITFGLPAFRAAKLAFADHSAFVGEAALDEYTSAGSISFDDREVFPTGGVKLRSVKVFGSGRIDMVIYHVASVYSLLGGPLSDVLHVATADLGVSEDVEILAIENEGVEAVVDGRHLYLGKADFLRKKGYVPVSDPDDEDIAESGEISMMFLVCDDEVVAKLYLRYRIDPGFEVTLKRLYKSGICVGIKTVDPNINDEMLGTKIKLTKYPVRVLKYSDVSESRRGSDRTDSGIVSKKSAKALLRIFTLCDKIKHVTKANIAVNIITMITGCIICGAVAILGNPAGVTSLYMALFQLFWIIPLYLMSKFMLL